MDNNPARKTNFYNNRGRGNGRGNSDRGRYQSQQSYERGNRGRDRGRAFKREEENVQPVAVTKILGAKQVQKTEEPIQILNPRTEPQIVKTEIPEIINHQEAIQLLNEKFEFCLTDNVNLLSDRENFAVIGILGCQGVGKSTLLNEILKHENSTIFPTQTPETQLQAGFETSGINMFVSQDRYIYLDTQPILSPAVLSKLIRGEKSISNELVSYENLHEIQSVQIAIFLFSICHIVIVVQDCIADTNVLKLIKTAEMLKKGIPDPSALKNDAASQDYWANSVFAFNKLDSNIFGNTEIFSNLQKMMNKFYSNTPILISNADTGFFWNEDIELKNLPNVPLSFFPIDSDVSKVSEIDFFSNDKTYQECLDEFRYKILQMPKKSFSRNISEKDWLRSAARIWEMIKSSNFIKDYNKMLQKQGLYSI